LLENIHVLKMDEEGATETNWDLVNAKGLKKV
jgi:hypothetical protein